MPTSPNQPADAYIPVFYDLVSGRTCTHRDILGQWEFMGSIYWASDGRAVILTEGLALIGEPCGTFEPAPAEYAISPALWRISPDGRYRAEFSAIPSSNDMFMTITDFQTGALLNQVKWSPAHGIEGISFQWVGNRYVLISRSSDRGPLLVEVGSPEVIEVMADLFRFGETPTRFADMIAYGQEVAGTGEYHLLLDIPSPNSDYHALALYHSETHTTEGLSFQYPAWVQTQGWNTGGYAFTPDGKWLLMVSPTSSSPIDEGSVWLRPIDGMDSDIRRIGKIFSLTMAPSGYQIAYVENNDSTPASGLIVASFSTFEIQSYWLAEGYNLYPMGWSLDNTKLLAHGILNASDSGTYNHALFLIEP